MDGGSQLVTDDIQVTTITKAAIHWVSGWYRALLISLCLGGWSCTRVDKYSSRILINDEGRQCWDAHNTLNCSAVVFASPFLHPCTVCLQLGSPMMLFLLLLQHTSCVLPHSLSISFLTSPSVLAMLTSITIFCTKNVNINNVTVVTFSTYLQLW